MLASTGTAADAPSDGDWLPLGVFALTKSDHPTSDLVVQMAVNKEGILRGNYTDTMTDKTQPIHGSVDKKTHRVAWSIGDRTCLRKSVPSTNSIVKNQFFPSEISS